MRRNLWQAVIAADQLLNCFTRGGWADETLSAHAWRCRERPGWRRARWLIDRLFFLQPNHCEQAYLAEKARAHSPPEERQLDSPAFN